jgi:hypothetical protein
MPTASTRHTGWYSCQRCRGPYARQDAVDAQAEADVLAHLAAEIARLRRPPAPPPKPPADLTAERGRAVARLGRLVDALGDGTIGGEVARAKIAAAEAMIADIDRRRAVAAAPPAGPSRAEQVERAEQLLGAWAGLDVAGRRQVVMALVERVELVRLEGKKWARSGQWALRWSWKPSG